MMVCDDHGDYGAIMVEMMVMIMVIDGGDDDDS